MDLQAVASTSSQPIKTNRARFVDFNPSQITSITLTPSTWTSQIPKLKGERQTVAVGRGNGAIQVLEWVGEEQGWVHCHTIPSSFPPAHGDNDAGTMPLISHLLFLHPSELPLSDLHLYSPDPLPFPSPVTPAQEEENAKISRSNEELAREMKAELEKIRSAKPRLFGVGTGGSEVIEWEWKDDESCEGLRGSVISVTASRSGSIFSMSPNPSHTLLALGCQDSSIRLLSVPSSPAPSSSLEPLAHVAQWSFDTASQAHRRKHPLQVLSMAWGPPRLASPTGGHWAERDSYLVAGCTDSTIRRFDVRSGKVVGTMKVERFKGEETLVWCVGVLRDDTIISGDSLGNVKIWDGKLNTQLRNIKAHRADVLCMSINMDGRSFFTSGVDQRISLIQLTPPSNPSTTDNRPSPHWSLVATKRGHSHDVKALAVSPSYSISSPRSILNQGTLPILLSGGIDLNLVLHNALPTIDAYKKAFSKKLSNRFVKEEGGGVLFEDSRPVKASYVPPSAEQQIVICESRRWIVIKRGREVSVWKVGTPGGGTAKREVHDVVENEEDIPEWARGKRLQTRWGLEDVTGATKVKGSGKGEYRKLLEMELDLNSDITRCQISRDGNWLAVSDLTQTKLFFMEVSGKNQNIIKPKRVKALDQILLSLLAEQEEEESTNTSSTALHFSPDSSLFSISLAAKPLVVVLTVFSDDATVNLKTMFNPWKHSSYGGRENRVLAGKLKQKDGEEDESEEYEGNGKAASDVVLAISKDNQWLAVVYGLSTICIFDLGAMKFHCNLPTPPQFSHVLSFLPSQPNSLLIAQRDNQFQIYDLRNKSIATWFPIPFTDPAFSTLSNLRQSLMGVVWHPRKELCAIFWSTDWLFSINLKPLHEGKRAAKKGKESKKRSREDGEGTGDNGKQEKQEKGVLEWTLKQDFKSVLAFDLVDADGEAGEEEKELLSVEKPFFTLLDELPAAWTRVGEYGA
ncbi:WD40 repeat-like protein [Atractiella rhizophila]|nr:WD40 repeat-like protein [Atractiella rhizophila]